MGFQIARQATIDAPRDRVWAYLSDFARHPEWADPKHDFRIQPPSQVRAGATFSSIGKDMGRDSKNDVTIVEVVPGERIVYDAAQDGGTFVWRNALELADAGTGTRVTKRESLVSARFPWNAIIAVVGPLLQQEAAKAHDGDLNRIGARLVGAKAEVAS